LLSYKRAIELKPDYLEAYLGYGTMLHDLKRFDEALINYECFNALEPDRIILLEKIIATKMMACDWSGYQECLNKIANNKESALIVFNLLALIDDPKFHKAAAETYITSCFPLSKLLPATFSYSSHKKIRVGYFSSDFQEHPVSYLTAEMYELHNREQFEVVAFSYGKSNKTEIRKRLENAFDIFIDVRNKSDQEVATLAREMEIDIAIDLSGFTRGSRTDIFAMRAAPIQVNYLGYAGTMAAEYIDYIIGDSTVIPNEAQPFYSEKVVYLPGTFMVSDSTLKPSKEIFSRKDFNLPNEGFVFSCFNASYKITPATFLGWMRVLKTVDGSVLWLSHMNETAIKNLKEEAKKAGVSSERIIFASRMPSLADHLNRIRLADLFLDTFPYNAHTTSNDALRVGLPVLTLMGESFASRVAASLLNSVGMPELITNSQEDYEALAIELALNPEKLRKLRNKLLENLPDSYLTDTKRFAENLESAYQVMYQRCQDSLQPDHIYIEG